MCLILKCPECDNKFEPDKNKCRDVMMVNILIITAIM